MSKKSIKDMGLRSQGRKALRGETDVVTGSPSGVGNCGQEAEQLRRAPSGLLGVWYLPGRRRKGLTWDSKGLEVRSEDRRTRPVLTETGIWPQLAQFPSLPLRAEAVPLDQGPNAAQRRPDLAVPVYMRITWLFSSYA